MEDDVFVFEHNGVDFTEEHLSSLCRFGFSNKRHLHTIGFRGIGFKSTFSLGEEVKLVTPTLTLAFDRKRFTEPVWLNSGHEHTGGTTQVRIKITREESQEWLSSNIQQWASSPASILFFRNIRNLEFERLQISVQALGAGPTQKSQWIELIAEKKWKLLLLRSEEEAFPEDAVDEVRQERGDEEFRLPPCSVEIVYGLTGIQRLYTVLPTGAELNSTFSCNAPFIQDPGRMGIKHPVYSPTNKWLLERAGLLIAETIEEWVNASGESMEHRAESYGCLPSVDDEDMTQPAKAAQSIIAKAISKELEGAAIVL